MSLRDFWTFEIDGGKAERWFAIEDVHEELDAFISVVCDEYCFQVGEAAFRDDDSLAGLQIRYARRVACKTLVDYLDNFILHRKRMLAEPHERS